MTEQELLIDCLRRLNQAAVAPLLNVQQHLEDLLAGRIRPKAT